MQISWSPASPTMTRRSSTKRSAWSGSQRSLPYGSETPRSTRWKISIKLRKRRNWTNFDHPWKVATKRALPSEMEYGNGVRRLIAFRSWAAAIARISNGLAIRIWCWSLARVPRRRRSSGLSRRFGGERSMAVPNWWCERNRLPSMRAWGYSLLEILMIFIEFQRNSNAYSAHLSDADEVPGDSRRHGLYEANQDWNY